MASDPRGPARPAPSPSSGADDADETEAAYEEALAKDPDDLDLLASAADFFLTLRESEFDESAAPGHLERALELARRGSRIAKRAGDDDAIAEFALLEGMALNDLGDAQAALARLDEGLAVRPQDPDLQRERGLALYELCRFAEAREQLGRVAEAVPEDAWAQHTLGLIAERDGDPAEARRRFARATRLSPDDFPPPVTFAEREFDAALEAALTELPAPVRDYLANVAITVEEIPDAEDLRGAEPPLSPGSLGMFRGAPLGQKASMDPWSHFPSSIVLYQRNLERFARSREELVDQIRVTLLHEVGHFLGLDEHDLWERGLD